MRETLDLIHFARENGPEELILCTIVHKKGSSYRDVGAKKLISSGSGKTCGVLSGGCLEAAIEKVARENFSRLPVLKSFSTMSDDDRLLGYQIGCSGIIDVLFEKIPATQVPTDLEIFFPFGNSPREIRGVEVSLNAETLGRRRIAHLIPKPSNEIFFDRWIEPIELAIVGCGADVDPYIDLAALLGWKISFVDYRSDLVNRMKGMQERTPRVRHLPVAEIASSLPQGPRSAVVLATHNFEADLEILKNMAELEFGYIGCIGPRSRFERIKTDLRDFHRITLSPEFEKSIFAPAGVSTRDKAPVEVGLSVTAQIHIELNPDKMSQPWTIILAAGASSRFGQPKALATWHSHSLLQEALSKARVISGNHVAVVTGAHRDKILPTLDGITEIFNPNWEAGIGSSIARGLEGVLELDSFATGTLIMPVDQPLVTPSHLSMLALEARKHDRCSLTSMRRILGPPAAVPRLFFERIISRFRTAKSLERGLKAILDPHEYIAVHAPNQILDVDRPTDLTALAGLEN